MEPVQWSVEHITQKNLNNYDGCIPVQFRKQILNREAQAFGAVLADGEKAGAVVAAEKEKQIRILSVYVEPERRRNGIGSALLERLRTVLEETGKEGISMDYPYPVMREVELFLLHCGFREEAEGNQIYSIPVADIGSMAFLRQPVPEPEGGLLSLKDLPEEQRFCWLRRFGRDLPEDLSPKNAGGEVLEEESLVYVQRGEVTAFSICSRLGENVIYLAALYAKTAAVKALVPLLQKTAAGICRKYEGETLRVSAATDTGKHLAERLFKGEEEKVDIQMMRTSVWRKESEETLMEINAFGTEYLAPRLNGISRLLDEMGIENGVLLGVDKFPAVLAIIDQREYRITYLPVGELEKEQFVMNLTTAVAGEEPAGLELLGICEQFNLNSFLASAVYIPMENQAILRLSIPESDGMPDRERLEFIIGLFRDNVSEFQKLQKN